MARSKNLSSTNIWNKASGWLDQYRVYIGIFLVLLIFGAGAAWLIAENNPQQATENSQLREKLDALANQNEKLLTHLKEIETKHNRLVEDLVREQSAGAPTRETEAGKRVAGISDNLAYTKQSELDGNSQSSAAAEGLKKTEPININSALPTALDSLPGIGPAYAGRIIDYREQNGGFKAIEEIMNVKGIGPKTFEKLKDKITI